ncbi:hypothetical protein KDA82_39615, partial [Streptomyces daliensis]|nr:hypothetical protein [Streptomyces daliensis]
HPGVTVEEVRERTGFDLALAEPGPGGPRAGEVPYTRDPTPEELRLIREVIDPHAARDREVSP